jgi:uncharacterized membrane protein
VSDLIHHIRVVFGARPAPPLYRIIRGVVGAVIAVVLWATGASTVVWIVALVLLVAVSLTLRATAPKR